jgi:hypothetical protein
MTILFYLWKCCGRIDECKGPRSRFFQGTNLDHKAVLAYEVILEQDSSFLYKDMEIADEKVWAIVKYNTKADLTIPPFRDKAIQLAQFPTQVLHKTKAHRTMIYKTVEERYNSLKLSKIDKYICIYMHISKCNVPSCSTDGAPPPHGRLQQLPPPALGPPPRRRPQLPLPKRRDAAVRPAQPAGDPAGDADHGV